MKIKKIAVNINELDDEYYCGHEIVNGKRIHWEVFQIDHSPPDKVAWVWVRLND